MSSDSPLVSSVVGETAVLQSQSYVNDKAAEELEEVTDSVKEND